MKGLPVQVGMMLKSCGDDVDMSLKYFSDHLEMMFRSC